MHHKMLKTKDYKMKRPKKIRKGDIFVDNIGSMRIILNKKEYLWFCFELYDKFKKSFIFSRRDFETNKKGISKYYLGNITDIKPKGKF